MKDYRASKICTDSRTTDSYWSMRLDFQTTGPMHFVSVVFTPPSPPHLPRQCLASNLSSLYSSLTLSRCGLSYPCDWRGFVGARKKTSVGLLVLKSSLVPAENFHKLSGRVWGCGRNSPPPQGLTYRDKKHPQWVYWVHVQTGNLVNINSSWQPCSHL